MSTPHGQGASIKTVLVLGAGMGGIVTARLLRRHLPRAHRVVLVDREPRHLFPPSLLWLMVSARREQQIVRPLAGLGTKGIEFVNGEVEHIDAESRSVEVGGRKLAADYLVIALGAELAPETIPGLGESGHNFYSIEGATSLAQARLGLSQGNLVVLVSGVPFKCPAAPYEGAMLLAADFRARGLGSRVSVSLYTPEPGPMPVAGAEVSAKVRHLVESTGVRLNCEHAVASVNPSARVIHFKNGATAPFDLLAYVPPHRAPEVVRSAGLVGEAGWVPVDRSTLETRVPGVYAIGDITGIPLVSGRPLPKAGVFARRQAEVVANNIAHAITGRGRPRAFDGHGACFVEIGGGLAGFGSGNFFAEPSPQVRLRGPSRLFGWSKVAHEKYWLRRWFG